MWNWIRTKLGITKLDSAVADLMRHGHSDIQGEIAAVDRNVADLCTNLNALNRRLSAITVKVETNKECVDKMGQRFEALNGNSAQLLVQVHEMYGALASRITKLEAKGKRHRKIKAKK